MKVRERQQRMNIILGANNELTEYKFKLSTLRKLKVKIRHAEIITNLKGLGLTKQIEEEELILINKIQALQKLIESRIAYLLGTITYEENSLGKWVPKVTFKVFCEVLSLENGESTIPPKSITKYPIQQISNIDLNRGYIKLTRCRIIQRPNTKQTIIISNLYFMLRTGEVVENSYFIRDGLISLKYLKTPFL